MTRAVVAFGANLGDRETTIAAAMRELDQADGVELVEVSPLYETPALKTSGVDRDAPRYVNGVALFDTTLAAHELLDLLLETEKLHGRERGEIWADRTLDLDLIDLGGQQITDAKLMLPHPRAWQRAFVLQPWLDLDPDAELSGYGAVAALRAAAHDEVVRR